MEFTCILTTVSLPNDLDFRVHASARLSVHVFLPKSVVRSVHVQ